MVKRFIVYEHTFRLAHNTGSSEGAQSESSMFDTGGGLMGGKVHAFGWAATPLGAIEGWTSALRVGVELMMSSHFSSCLFCGPELVAIYNNGYQPILGAKPDAAWPACERSNS